MASSRSKTYGYGSVKIFLENCIIPKEKLEKTPSVIDGLNIQIETDLRIVGCEYIQTAGILLKLPQVAMATGQVLFQRFYYSKSFVRYDVEVYAMACLFLAAKTEESPRRIRDVINVFHHIKQKRNNRPIVPMEYLGNTYFTLKNLVIKAERRILKELGFCVHVQHPHKVVITFLQVLECEKNQQLAQIAWNFMNDALRTDVFVRYQPETIACACIFLSARQLKIALPSRPPWWELFDGKIQHIENVCLTLLKLYMRPKVSLQTLNKAVDRLKKSLPDKKTKAATDASSDKSYKSSGSTFSRSGSPSNVSPTIDATKSRGEEMKKNGGSKSESHGTKTSKKSTKITESRSKTKKTASRSLSPVIETRRSSSGAESDSDSSSSGGESATGDSGSSPDDSRKKKITRQSNRPREHMEDKGKDTRSDGGRKLYQSKSDTNSYRRCRDRSRSPYRRSRSRSKERRNKHGRRGDNTGSLSRNGDYKIGDKYDKRTRR